MKTLRSFAYAWQGLKYAFLTQNNFRIHLAAACVATIMGFLCQISQTEWFVILICMALVISGELFNTALEKFCDLAYPERQPVIKIVKDLSAGAVLISALISLVVGSIIFIPKIILILKAT